MPNGTIRKNNGTTVLYDGQIGYHLKKWNLNQFVTNYTYDKFEKYSDGVYEISAYEYTDFTRRRGIQMSFYKQTKSVIMLKRRDIYMFLAKTKKGLCLLNGGQFNRCLYSNIEYYYDNMLTYKNKLVGIIEPYNRFMKKLSDEIKCIGGSGEIHGCIIDISFSSHIYVNPYDGKITPYWASDISGRLVYDDLKELIEAKERFLMTKFKYLEKSKSIPLINLCLSGKKNNNLPLLPVWMSGTEIYGISKTMLRAQYVIDTNIIRIWNDEVLHTDADNEFQDGYGLIELNDN